VAGVWPAQLPKLLKKSRLFNGLHSPVFPLVTPLLKLKVTGLSETGSVDGTATVGCNVGASVSPDMKFRWMSANEEGFYPFASFLSFL